MLFNTSRGSGLCHLQASGAGSAALRGQAGSGLCSAQGSAARVQPCLAASSRSPRFSKHVCFEREKVVASMSDSFVLTTSDHPCYQALLGPIKRHS